MTGRTESRALNSAVRPDEYLVRMTLTALLSTCAMVMGLGGIVPQLVRMVRTRSAGGQALVGWGLGTAAHASMTYVNLVGFHSMLLGAYSIDRRRRSARRRWC